MLNTILRDSPQYTNFIVLAAEAAGNEYKLNRAEIYRFKLLRPTFITELLFLPTIFNSFVLGSFLVYFCEVKLV